MTEERSQIVGHRRAEILQCFVSGSNLRVLMLQDSGMRLDTRVVARVLVCDGSLGGKSRDDLFILRVKVIGPKLIRHVQDAAPLAPGPYGCPQERAIQGTYA